MQTVPELALPAPRGHWCAWWARHLAAQRPPASSRPMPQVGMPANEDLADFEAFFRRYEPRITGYLWRMVNDEATACDLAQETFLRAWQHFSEVSAARQPASWLFRVATNLALNEIRRRSSRMGAATPIGPLNDPAASDPTIRFIERDFVQQILAELPPKARALLILREVQDVPFAEVSQMLGMSSAAAKMALCRARVQFRERYLRKGEGR